MVEEFNGIRSVRICDADGLDTEVYILDCEGGLILVDVGFTPECQLRIQSELDSIGKSWNDIKMIIITHAHGDHIENLPSVKELTNAEVVIGDGDDEALLDRTGVRADVVLGHGDLIGACGGIEIIHVPGHSPGNLCIYLRKHRAIIAGDTIFGDSEGNLEAPPEKYCTDVIEAAKNLKTLEEYDFDKILLSHGKNTYENAKEKVLKLIEKCT
ncbi:MBL fold metallo-hydrolase [Candidatus Bathyarchaeota archaeon]|jgi:glyoxylase-like metal-dependent hydrolase (beta-lactamase superfamily II)|nr:MBL fold metallo-hydrolase [Candidatus Bathyarchaeota archaeon]